MDQVVLGIDGGGTHTRVAVVDIQGLLLSHVNWQGASSFHKDKRAAENVQSAIAAVLAKAGVNPADVAGIVAGIAGLDSEDDLKWAKTLTEFPGLSPSCPILHVNDAVVAQNGAFLGDPGIIAISGTGSNIFCIEESGRQISSYDFHHYARTAARFLAYDAVYKITAGETDSSDTALTEAVLAHLGADDIPSLARMGASGFVEDGRERAKLFGDLGPSVTRAAVDGSKLAKDICDRAAADIVTGIRLLGACFASERIPVALIGSVANSTPVCEGIAEALAAPSNRDYRLQEPALPAVLGAALMALELAGFPGTPISFADLPSTML